MNENPLYEKLLNQQSRGYNFDPNFAMDQAILNNSQIVKSDKLLES